VFILIVFKSLFITIGTRCSIPVFRFFSD